MFAVGSPEYTQQQSTPYGQRATVHHQVSCAEKLFQIFKVLSYFFGSLLFLFGSILFYPKYYTLWNGDGPLVGSWSFFFGCVCFLLGTHCDFFIAIRSNTTGSPFVRIVKAYNAALYVVAAGIFQLGALYFLPKYYAISASLGCWSFIIGCVFFCIGAAVDTIFLVITHEDKRTRGVQLGNLLSWGFVVAFGCFAGAVCFIVGSYFYLPRFIYLEDVDLATAYSNKAINYFVVGSCFFTINALAQIPDMLAGFKGEAVSYGGKDQPLGV